MIKNYLRYAVAAAFVASGAGNLAFAVDEQNPEQLNKPFSKPQLLIVDDSKKVEVKGRIGLSELGTPIADTDFYAFHGKAGDVVRLDIDQGMKTTGRSLNSLIGLFDSNGNVLVQKNDVGLREVDQDSISRLDPWIENIRLPQDGVYIVGVTSDAKYTDNSMRTFRTFGDLSMSPFEGVTMDFANGAYTLRIEGVSKTELALQINIDIKPNAKSITTHANSHGKIPVALLSSDEFNALAADQDSIRFGPPNGKGAKGKCNKNGANLLCHFDKGDAGFAEDDTEGMVSGTIGGKPFEGRGWLKVIPVRSKDD